MTVIAAFAASSIRAATPRSPLWRLRDALCVHHFETLGHPDPAAWHLNTGNGQAGGMQFTLPTWNRAPGRRARSLADIAAASVREQLRRARWVWAHDTIPGTGTLGSWHEWSTAPLCGLA